MKLALVAFTIGSGKGRLSDHAPGFEEVRGEVGKYKEA
jgi:hypothetical protein